MNFVHIFKVKSSAQSVHLKMGWRQLVSPRWRCGRQLWRGDRAFQPAVVSTVFGLQSAQIRDGWQCGELNRWMEVGIWENIIPLIESKSNQVFPIQRSCKQRVQLEGYSVNAFKQQMWRSFVLKIWKILHKFRKFSRHSLPFGRCGPSRWWSVYSHLGTTMNCRCCQVDLNSQYDWHLKDLTKNFISK